MKDSGTAMIQTNGMHGWSYLSPEDLIVFAKKALDLVESDASSNVLFSLNETYKAANRILNEKPPSKDRMKILYEQLIAAIEEDELEESMEICYYCGAIPETGACNSCKMD